MTGIDPTTCLESIQKSRVHTILIGVIVAVMAQRQRGGFVDHPARQAVAKATQVAKDW